MLCSKCLEFIWISFNNIFGDKLWLINTNYTEKFHAQLKAERGLAWCVLFLNRLLADYNVDVNLSACNDIHWGACDKKLFLTLHISKFHDKFENSCFSSDVPMLQFTNIIEVEDVISLTFKLEMKTAYQQVTCNAVWF